MGQQSVCTLPGSVSQSFGLTAWIVQTPMQATWVFSLQTALSFIQLPSQPSR